MTVIYGSSVADTTLTTACQMASTTGGAETSKGTTFTGTGAFGEIRSKGGASASVASLPTPTGNGWVFNPGAGTFATGNWSASVAMHEGTTFQFTSLTIRFYKYSGGTYTSIGSIALSTPTINATRTVFSFAATSMSSVTTATGDLIYVDLWWGDSGISGDSPFVYESTSATAGVASDMQATTSTFTAGGGGNAIVGRAQAKFAEALAARGSSRGRFLVSIGQKAPVRSRFTESIGESGRARAGLVISKGIAGRVRSVYKEAIKQQAAQHSRFLIANTLHIPLLRSRFLISLPVAAKARAKFVSAIGARTFSRSTFTIAKGLRGLARSRFIEAAVQRAGGRSRFQIAVPLREAVRSTFKITTATGHAITAYIRTKYTASIKQSASPRSRFQIRFSQASQVRATFKTAIKSTIPVARSRFLVSLRLVSRSHTKFIIRLFQRFQAQASFKSAAKVKTVAQSRFFTRFGVAVRNTSRFLVAVRVAGRSRSRFTLSIAQALPARTRFLVNQILVILPIRSITQAVTQALTFVWKALASLQLSSVQTASLTLTHLQGQSMPAPNSTILSTVTVTDINGAAVSNASVVTATVYFPDGSSTALSLGSGITNIGNGQYQAKYNTKNSGENREVWSITAADGVTIASEQFKVGISY